MRLWISPARLGGLAAGLVACGSVTDREATPDGQVIVATGGFGAGGAAAGTGGSGAGGATGGTGATGDGPLCPPLLQGKGCMEFTTKQEELAACLHGPCCPQTDACLKDEGCSSFLACQALCTHGDEACRAECEGCLSPQSATLHTLWTDCLTGCAFPDAGAGGAGGAAGAGGSAGAATDAGTD